MKLSGFMQSANMTDLAVAAKRASSLCQDSCCLSVLVLSKTQLLFLLSSLPLWERLQFCWVGEVGFWAALAGWTSAVSLQQGEAVAAGLEHPVLLVVHKPPAEPCYFKSYFSLENTLQAFNTKGLCYASVWKLSMQLTIKEH